MPGEGLYPDTDSDLAQAVLFDEATDPARYASDYSSPCQATRRQSLELSVDQLGSSAIVPPRQAAELRDRQRP